MRLASLSDATLVLRGDARCCACTMPTFLRLRASCTAASAARCRRIRDISRCTRHISISPANGTSSCAAPSPSGATRRDSRARVRDVCKRWNSVCMNSSLIGRWLKLMARRRGGGPRPSMYLYHTCEHCLWKNATTTTTTTTTAAGAAGAARNSQHGVRSYRCFGAAQSLFRLLLVLPVGEACSVSVLAAIWACTATS